MNDSIISIGNNAFVNCERLTEVTLGNSLISIGVSAFYGCERLTEVTLGNSLISIGDAAFYDCKKLRKLNANSNELIIPSSVVEIGESAFYNVNIISSDNPDSNRTKLTFVDTESESSNLMKSRRDAFYRGFKDSLTIPDSVKKIGRRAFYVWFYR